MDHHLHLNINNVNDAVTEAAVVAKRKAEDNLAAGYDVAAAAAAAPPPLKKPKNAEEEEAKRRARLESNRKAARESRRRKKVLVDELQRSVIFFTRANAQLKQKNEGLESMLFAARSQLEGSGGIAGMQEAAAAAPQDNTPEESKKSPAQVMAPAAAPTASPAVATIQPAPTAASANNHPPSQCSQVPNPVHNPAAAAATAAQQAAQQAMVQNNNLVANWLATMAATQASAVPNPMAAAMGLPPHMAAMGMFNPAVSANPATAAGLMGMAAAAGMGGMGVANPFLGQLQQASMGNGVVGGGDTMICSGGAAPVAAVAVSDGSVPNPSGPSPNGDVLV